MRACPDLVYRFRVIEGARHGGTEAEAVNRGLRFVFEPLAPEIGIQKNWRRSAWIGVPYRFGRFERRYTHFGKVRPRQANDLRASKPQEYPKIASGGGSRGSRSRVLQTCREHPELSDELGPGIGNAILLAMFTAQPVTL